MSTPEAIWAVAAIVAVLVGVGLWKREKRWPGAALAGAGVVAAAIPAFSGHPRTIVGLVGILGIASGMVADEKGSRVWGLLGVSVGFMALLVTVLYT